MGWREEREIHTRTLNAGPCHNKNAFVLTLLTNCADEMCSFWRKSYGKCRHRNESRRLLWKTLKSFTQSSRIELESFDSLLELCYVFYEIALHKSPVTIGTVTMYAEIKVLSSNLYVCIFTLFQCILDVVSICWYTLKWLALFYSYNGFNPSLQFWNPFSRFSLWFFPLLWQSD